MAKYTLELRTLEERSNKGVFDFEYDFYCEHQLMRDNFEKKFIDHYFFHEIGFETVQRFKKRLQSTLNMVMPKYVQLFNSQVEAEDINFLLNKDLTETTIREKQTNDESNVRSNGRSSNDYKESNLSNGNATLNMQDLTSISQGADSSSGETDGHNEGHEREELTFKSQGNIGITSSADLLEKWRSTFINLDEMLIEECKKLFMEVY